MPALARIRHALPQGRTLPTDAWASRHRALLAILWAHVLVLPVFSWLQGLDLSACIGPIAPVALAAVAGSLSILPLPTGAR